MIRLLKSTYERAIADLARSHPFAGERVGFLLGRSGNATGENAIVLLTDYIPVADEHYVDDRRVGASISGNAIRAAMQHALSTGASIVHVHLHDHAGVPSPSRTDITGWQGMLPAMAAVAPAVRHGALILSRDRACGLHWRASDRSFVRVPVTVVGNPLQRLATGDAHE